MITVHAVSTETYAPMLRSLAGLLDKASRHAATRNVDLVHAKLAPDMYDLAQQVQEACFLAKDGVARLTGKPEAQRDEVEKTLGGLKAQVERALDAISSVPADQFDEGESRDCSIPMDESMLIGMNGQRYLLGWSLPLFYFHVVTAYDILRHCGLDIGIQDFNPQVGDFIERRNG